MNTSRLLLISALATSSALAADAPLPAKISFNRDIRPIMSDTCFHCHGFDPKTREAGLRLDQREQAISKTENDIIGIVPGKPDQSEIIARILDADDPMPPEKAHKPLTTRQKALFKQWVAEGAVYEPHWAYAPIVRPSVPAGVNPIDYFVQAKLAEKNIKPSPEASPEKLRRRLALDLIGLPPNSRSALTPNPLPKQVVERKVSSVGEGVRHTGAQRRPPNDPPLPSATTHPKGLNLGEGRGEGQTPRAFETASGTFDLESEIEAHLASPHFGERMAVWWLDIARFADTVGFHGDQNQRIFPYRDYVIAAFNTNKRFDQFTLEQLAGDLLPKPTQEQLVATGYNRLNMMTREGGAQAKEYLVKYGAERVRSVAAAWFGSTFGCAECHDHKFDPIKTRDFYELQSFFADVKQWGTYADYKYTPVPELVGFNNESPFPPEIQVDSPYLQKRLKVAQADLDAQLSAARKAAKPKPEWLKQTQAFLAKHADGWVQPPPITAAGPAKAKVSGKDGVIDLSQGLGKTGSLVVTLPCTDLQQLAAIRIEVIDDNKTTAKPASFKFTASLLRANGKKQGLTSSLAEATQFTPDHKQGYQVMGIERQWLIPHQDLKGNAQGYYMLSTPQACTPADKVELKIEGTNARPIRIALSPIASLKPLEHAKAVIAVAKAGPALADVWLMSAAPDPQARDRARQSYIALRELNGGKAWSMVTLTAKPLPVRVLPRGNFMDETGPVVLPATPSFLPGRLESSAQKRLTRLDLAKWITSKDNPITARAVMNRLWQQFFGTALSASVDDLGSQGEPPSHPELLEWLASEFRDTWDIKHMIRLIVSSHTYRQSSSLRPELKDIDPANRLLASQNPRRLDAEFVRDNALSIAGLLDVEDIGGPSVKPYQPADYYDALQFPNRDYISTTGSEQYRRGLYMHWQRTFLHPMLANFDAPARDECAAMRTQSNTPQQALTLLNDPSFVECARVLGERVINTKLGSDAERIGLACRLTWAREPKAKEITSLTAFLKTQRDYYRANAEDAKKLASTGLAAKTQADVKEVAAWTSLARVLLNAQETITRY